MKEKMLALWVLLSGLPFCVGEQLEEHSPQKQSLERPSSSGDLPLPSDDLYNFSNELKKKCPELDLTSGGLDKIIRRKSSEITKGIEKKSNVIDKQAQGAISKEEQKLTDIIKKKFAEIDKRSEDGSLGANLKTDAARKSAGFELKDADPADQIYYLNKVNKIYEEALWEVLKEEMEKVLAAKEELRKRTLTPLKEPIQPQSRPIRTMPK